MSDCTPGLFWKRPHKFEARYDTIPIDLADLLRKLQATLKNVNISDETINSLATKSYVCDVCVRCGKVVKRS